jgi:hypothetical protein
VVLVFLTLLAIGIGASRASIISITASGTITSETAGATSIVGDPFSVTTTFDPAQTTQYPGFIRIGDGTTTFSSGPYYGQNSTNAFGPDEVYISSSYYVWTPGSASVNSGLSVSTRAVLGTLTNGGAITYGFGNGINASYGTGGSGAITGVNPIPDPTTVSGTFTTTISQPAPLSYSFYGGFNPSTGINSPGLLVTGNINSLTITNQPPPSCSSILQGSVQATAGGPLSNNFQSTEMHATFTPAGGIAAAEAACGVVGFDWTQKEAVPAPNPFFENNPLDTNSPISLPVNTPYTDPPKNGYTYFLTTPGQNWSLSSSPLYFDPSTTVYDNSLAKWVTASTLSFKDVPADQCIDGILGASPAWDHGTTNGPTGQPITFKALCNNSRAPYGSFLSFRTDLVGILSGYQPGTDCFALGTCVDFSTLLGDPNLGFNWEDNYNGTFGGGSTGTANFLPIDIGSGDGGVMLFDVPEPSSVWLLTGSVLFLYFLSKRKMRYEFAKSYELLCSPSADSQSRGRGRDYVSRFWVNSGADNVSLSCVP